MYLTKVGRQPADPLSGEDRCKEMLATILGCCWNFRAFILFYFIFLSECMHARLKSLKRLGSPPRAFATTPLSTGTKPPSGLWAALGVPEC